MKVESKYGLSAVPGLVPEVLALLHPPSNYPRDPGNPFCRFNLVGLKVLVQKGFTPKNNICYKLVIPTLTCSKTKVPTKRKTQGTRSKTLPNIN